MPGIPLFNIVVFIWLAMFLSNLKKILQKNNSSIYLVFSSKLPDMFTFSYYKLSK